MAQNVAALKAAGVEADTAPLDEVTGPLTELRTALAGLRGRARGRRRARPRWPRPSTPATSCCRRWPRSRAAADTLEGIVADDLWPLPTYQEMLYIR